MMDFFTNRNILARLLIVSFCFSLILMFSLTLSSCTDSGAYTIENRGETVEIKQGDSITLKLESNPTTGYGWQLTDDMDGAVMSFSKTEFKQSKKAQEMVGSGGYEYFYFQAESPGTTDIILNYARPWEEGVEPIDVFKLSIIVK